jgi:glutaredoxin 3
MVKEYLDGKNVSYTEYNVAEDAEKRQEMVQKSGQMGVPVVFIGESMVIGFDQSKIDELLAA